ncbi:MAG: complex I subunit 1 family protein [bacterium]
MDEILKAVFYVVVFPGLAFTAVLGLFICWVDRKVTARIQSRMGPPWYQCYADVLKLMCKTMILPRGSRRVGFLFAPLIGFAGMALVSALVWMVNFNAGVGFVGDLIVVLYLLILPSLALIIGGSSSGNPFGAVGVAREMKMILAYELPFLIAVLTVVVKTKTILMGEIIGFQSLNGAMAVHPSCIIALVVCFVCIQAKLGYIPFDIPEAEQEIIGGTLAEYSGVSLALFKITNAMMLVILPVFLITLFLGGIRFHVGGIAVAVAEYGAFLLLIVVIKSIFPRLRIDQAVRFFWGLIVPVSVAGMVLALVGV